MPAWDFQTDDDYADRPGLSPVTAALLAAGVIRPHDRILDLGCGTGIDTVALVLAGATQVTGVDKRARALTLARKRARFARVDDRARFVRGDAYRLHDAVGGGHDAAIDTLLGNNVRDQDRYAASVARVLRRGGLLAATYKVYPSEERLWDFEADGPFAPHFRIRHQARTHLPTRTMRGRRTYVDVVTAVMERR